MKPQEDIHAQYMEDITCLSTLLWLEVNFRVEPYPQKATMHSIYLYTDIYKRLKIY